MVGVFLPPPLPSPAAMHLNPLFQRIFKLVNKGSRMQLWSLMGSVTFTFTLNFSAPPKPCSLTTDHGSGSLSWLCSCAAPFPYYQIHLILKATWRLHFKCLKAGVWIPSTAALLLHSSTMKPTLEISTTFNCFS